MSGGSILIIDGHSASRDSISKMLLEAGHTVRTVGDILQAEAAIAKGEARLIIADTACLRAGNGIFSEKDLGVPIILTSTAHDAMSPMDALRAGASDYLIKPFSREILELAIKRCISNGSGRQELLASMGGGEHRLEKGIITQDPLFQKVLRTAFSVARSNSTVLIQGESGTGKELLAHYIHKNSPRRNGPYVAINCAALPESLAESELFGHEKGAFTGAVSKKPGRFELAHQGTLVLDEISEMPLSIQAKLLRVLQEREVERVGGTRPVPVDVRVIAVSNRDLKNCVKEGKFREDLYYRVNVVPLVIPPLRERRGDIRMLARYFIEKFSVSNGISPKQLTEEGARALEARQWKGNVRELENVIERAVLLCEGDLLKPEHLMHDDASKEESSAVEVRAGMSMKDMERYLISKTLEEVNGNRTHAAKMLGISIRTLRNKLKEYRDSLGCQPRRRHILPYQGKMCRGKSRPRGGEESDHGRLKLGILISYSDVSSWYVPCFSLLRGKES